MKIIIIFLDAQWVRKSNFQHMTIIHQTTVEQQQQKLFPKIKNPKSANQITTIHSPNNCYLNEMKVPFLHVSDWMNTETISSFHLVFAFVYVFHRNTYKFDRQQRKLLFFSCFSAFSFLFFLCTRNIDNHCQLRNPLFHFNQYVVQ